MFTSVRARRLLAIAGMSLLPPAVLVTTPAEAAGKPARYSFSFRVLESGADVSGNVLRARIDCPAGEGVELAVSVALDERDPTFDPNAVPATGATTQDRFPAGFPLVLECAGKPRTYDVELFPNVEGYDLPGEGPCIGFCYHHTSPLLQARQKVDVDYWALTPSGTELTGATQTRVRK